MADTEPITPPETDPIAGYTVMRNPAGESVAIPVEQAKVHADAGYAPATPEETDAFRAQVQRAKQYGTLGQQAATAAEGVASGLSFGLNEPLETATGITTPEAIQARKEVNPNLHAAGEFAGIAAPALFGEEAGILGKAAQFTAPAVIGRLGEAGASAAEHILPGAAGNIARAAARAEQANTEARVAGRLADEAVGTATAESAASDAATAEYRATHADAMAKAAKEGASPLSRIIARVAPDVTQGVIEGAAYGAQQPVDEAMLGDPSKAAEHLAADVGYGALVGGGLGAALGITHSAAAETARAARKTITKTTDYLWEHYPPAAAALTGSTPEEVKALMDARHEIAAGVKPETILARLRPAPEAPAGFAPETVPPKFEKEPFRYDRYQPFMRPAPVPEEVPVPENIGEIASHLTPELNAIREQGMELRRDAAGYRRGEVGKILEGRSHLPSGEMAVDSLAHVDTPPLGDVGRHGIVLSEMGPAQRPIGLSFTPDMAARMAEHGMSEEQIHNALLDAHRAGFIELQPESGLNRLTPEQMRSAPQGPQGTRLTWARITDKGRSAFVDDGRPIGRIPVGADANGQPNLVGGFGAEDLARARARGLTSIPAELAGSAPVNGWEQHMVGEIAPAPMQAARNIMATAGNIEQSVAGNVLRPSAGIVGSAAERGAEKSILGDIEAARNELAVRLADAKSANAVHDAMTRFKQDVGVVAKFGKESALWSDPERKARNAAKDIYRATRQALEDEKTWGEAGAREARLNERIEASSRAFSNIDTYLRGKQFRDAPGSVDRPWTVAKTTWMLEHINDPKYPEVREAMQDWLREHGALIDEAERSAQTAEDEAFKATALEGRTKIAGVQDELARARLAKDLEQKAREIEDTNKTKAAEYRRYAKEVVKTEQEMRGQAKEEHTLSQADARKVRETERAEAKARNDAGEAAARGDMKAHRAALKERDRAIKERADLLRGTTGELGHGGFWTGLALAHHPVLAPLWLAARAAMSPLRTVKTLAAVEAAAQRVQAKMGGMVKSFVNGASRLETAGRREVLAGVANSHGRSLEDAQKRYDKQSAQIQQMANDPQVMTDRLHSITEELGAHAPNISTQLGANIANTTRFLASKIPRGPDGTPLKTLSRSQLATFNRYVDAANEPLSVIKQAANGTLTPEAVETVATCHPQLYAAMAAKTATDLAASKHVSYATKMQASMLLQHDVTGGTLNPVDVLMGQSVFAPPTPPQQQKKPPKAKRGTKGLHDAQDAMLPSQRLEQVPRITT